MKRTRLSPQKIDEYAQRFELPSETIELLRSGAVQFERVSDLARNQFWGLEKRLSDVEEASKVYEKDYRKDGLYKSEDDPTWQCYLSPDGMVADGMLMSKKVHRKRPDISSTLLHRVTKESQSNTPDYHKFVTKKANWPGLLPKLASVLRTPIDQDDVWHMYSHVILPTERDSKLSRVMFAHALDEVVGSNGTGVGFINIQTVRHLGMIPDAARTGLFIGPVVDDPYNFSHQESKALVAVHQPGAVPQFTGRTVTISRNQDDVLADVKAIVNAGQSFVGYDPADHKLKEVTF